MLKFRHRFTSLYSCPPLYTFSFILFQLFYQSPDSFNINLLLYTNLAQLTDVLLIKIAPGNEPTIRSKERRRSLPTRKVQSADTLDDEESCIMPQESWRKTQSTILPAYKVARKVTPSKKVSNKMSIRMARFREMVTPLMRSCL